MSIRTNRKELCYLILFAFFIFSTLLSYSTLDIGRTLIYISRVFLILLSIFSMCQKELKLKDLMCFACLIIISVIIKIKTNHWNVLDIGLLVLGAKDIKFKNIARTYRLIASFTIILIILLFIFGVIEENVTYRKDGTIRHSYGFIYATDLVALIFYILLVDFYLAFLEKKNMLCRYIFYSIFSFLSYVLCHARLGAICILLIIFAGVYLKNRKGKLYKLEKIMLSYSVVFFAVVIIVLTQFYIFSPHNPFLSLIDKVLSYRLYYSKMGVVLYGYKLFGQEIEMHGVGADEDYFFIDSSYMNIALIYGILVLVVVIYIFTKIAKDKVRDGELLIPVIIFLIAVNSFVGQQMFDVAYDIFLLMFLAYTNENSINLKRIMKRFR